LPSDAHDRYRQIMNGQGASSNRRRRSDPNSLARLRAMRHDTQVITYMDDSTLAERTLAEPPSYAAELYDAMLEAARLKLERDNPPAFSLAECDWLIAELENRARLSRALAAAQQHSGLPLG
jgi:hypothetical protein